MGFLSNSTSFYIKLRNIPLKDIDKVLEAVSKHFNVINLDIRKHRGCS
jgi:hypothetical protein